MLRIHIKDKPGFERKGNDLYTTVSIPFTTAVLGGEAIVSTLTGNVKCKIAAGTQSGSKIRLKGKGVANIRNRAYPLYGSLASGLRLDRHSHRDNLCPQDVYTCLPPYRQVCGH